MADTDKTPKDYATKKDEPLTDTSDASSTSKVSGDTKLSDSSKSESETKSSTPTSSTTKTSTSTRSTTDDNETASTREMSKKSATSSLRSTSDTSSDVKMPARSEPRKRDHELGSRELKRGATGGDVKALQEFLGAQRVGSFDGEFGPRTEYGVRAFQRQRGMSVTGVAGERILAKIRK